MRQKSDGFKDDSGNEFVLRLLDFVADIGAHQLAHDLAGNALKLVDLGVEVVEDRFAVEQTRSALDRFPGSGSYF